MSNYVSSNTESKIQRNRIIANRLKIKPQIKNYNKKQKIYGIEDQTNEARKAKKYIKDFADPDILELIGLKKWNICSKLTDKATEKKDLEQRLFHVKHGLTDSNTIKFKEPLIYDGVEVKFDGYFKWNNSFIFDKKEKENMINHM